MSAQLLAALDVLDGEGAAELLDLQRQHPIAFGELWHKESPATSQRRCFQEMGELITIICGGNRSGKTQGCAMYVAAAMHGRQHPDAREWCRKNDLPLTVLPASPATVWAVALDSGDSREYLRPAVAKYLPPDARWRNQYGFGQAEVILPNGGKCVFKSVDQRADGFQGSNVDLVWFDEEPNDQAVCNEALMRLVDRQGKCIFSMTPLRGMTWLYDRWVANTPSDAAVHWIHGVDNPHLPAGALERLLRQYGPHERAARAQGTWTTLEGRIYGDFQRHTHVIKSFKPDPSWPVYMGIDFGTRAPFALVVCALDTSSTGDDTLHVIDEHYQADWTLSQHAAKIKEMIEKYGQPEWIVADPEDRGSRLALSREHGITNCAAKKPRGSVRGGINDVCERLALDVAGKPHLLVHDNCSNLIQEFESYVWDESGVGEARDRPKARQKDHALDALRYCISKLAISDFGIG